MNPSGRTEPRTPDVRATAAEILDRVERSGAWASRLLETHEQRFADRRDRALLHETVLGVLRGQRLLDAALQRASHRPLSELDGLVRATLRVGAYALISLDRVPDHAAVSTAVESVRRRKPRAAGFVNGVLRRLARTESEPPVRPRERTVEAWALWTSHPDWWVERVVERSGWDAAIALLEANNRPARTTLCPNGGRISAERLAATLAESGCRARPGRVVPDSLRVLGGSPGDALSRGLCWVQDEASQLVSWLVAAETGQTVLDVCAAPGGKTMHLANRVGTAGRVIAVDRHRGRMKRLARNVERCGLGQVRPLIADMTAPPPLGTRFERILVDAPCSGTGTLRRHPEIRWRLTPEAIKLISLRQERLLERAAGLLAEGGRLVYSVCSMEPEEGERVIASFLDRNPVFSAVDPSGELPEPARRFVGADGYLRTDPGRDGLDGFFAAVLGRTRAS
ncbi:MAG: 16S rRNA (cytosine(967)-C(5))-methyltransferase RsmB [Acidobacteria bacterium]|nr:16S rRNA (cytosine(967)-C(5))-methyltransferase RsmB [Acidobacteriota bacterium]NIM63358.1 16S rRNA (cytosine(967)-C(5))-methyltransferase RsmB [Acidobacteriota bacterium]NIO60067.1 16S rRNA (cytosine(967)-C(5))-methyltransferase RsmB [Acidobacteriota bacterium]NIQ31475.1 16S rRNA (cytosine(967)-C(5))-methyltransferase RsmB [Acidobacteriota bacterium]NIQ86250.1 16S rRNA (cytosine(967)-C(5))-methyltransferase RsmB [Acidobacteriota bacterium]